MSERDDYADNDLSPPLEWVPSREEMDLAATQGVLAACVVMVGLMVVMALFAYFA